MGSERDAAIANMESMGFPRADIDRAMRAAFFNPDRAVEYLLTVRRSSPFRIVFSLTLETGYSRECTPGAAAAVTEPSAQSHVAATRRRR